MGLSLMKTAETPPETYYTVQEVAQRLKVSCRSIYTLIDNGRLTAVDVAASGGGKRQLRISTAALDKFLRQPAKRFARSWIKNDPGLPRAPRPGAAAPAPDNDNTDDDDSTPPSAA